MIPDFQDLLRRHLLQRPELLGQSHSAGQLIGLAFEGQQHLDLAPIMGLSVNTVRAALEMKQLASVKSVTICSDTMRNTPTQLIDELCRQDDNLNFYFLQEIGTMIC